MTIGGALSDLNNLLKADDIPIYYKPSIKAVMDTIALEQEPKTGRWISHYDEDAKEGWYECDRCHTERAFNTDYCPDCGCRMTSGKDE